MAFNFKLEMPQGEDAKRQKVLAIVLAVVLGVALGFVTIKQPWKTHVRKIADTTPTATTPTKTTETPRSTETTEKPKPAIVRGVSPEARVLAALAQRPAVVVSLYSAGALVDNQARLEAQAGAVSAGVPFLSFNMLDEKSARGIASMLEKQQNAQISSVGPATGGAISSTPVILVFKRPMSVALKFDGLVDRDVVAQGAMVALGSPGGQLWQRQANAVCESSRDGAEEYVSEVAKLLSTPSTPTAGLAQVAVLLDRGAAWLDTTQKRLGAIRPGSSSAKEYQSLLSSIAQESGIVRSMAQAARSRDAEQYKALTESIDPVLQRQSSLLAQLGLTACDSIL